jgi:hypothetical protein
MASYVSPHLNSSLLLITPDISYDGKGLTLQQHDRNALPFYTHYFHPALSEMLARVEFVFHNLIALFNCLRSQL